MWCSVLGTRKGLGTHDRPCRAVTGGTSLPRYDPYEKVTVELRAHLEAMSRCRDAACLVPDGHPFYLDQQGPARPCMPVVPTRLKPRGVMVLGFYPNTRYRNHQGDPFVPADDIDEPFEDTRYFDGYGVRRHESGALLEEAYLRPLGLRREDVYITNVVKCFLFDEQDVKTCVRHGFAGAGELRSTYERFPEVAAVCQRLWLRRELEIAEPELVICLGSEVFRVVHAKDGTPAAKPVMGQVAGKVLRAGERKEPWDTRDPNGPFFGLNVVHLYHPGALLREEPKGRFSEPHREHLEAVRSAMVELGLTPAVRASAPPTRRELDAFLTRLANEPERRT